MPYAVGLPRKCSEEAINVRIADTKPGVIDIKWFEQGVPANPEHRPDIETTLT